jgi:uroporphyrinogen decarboxylase
MTSRERVIKTLNFESVDRAPRQLWALPGIPMFRMDELNEVLEEFPSDFGGPQVQYGVSKRASGTPNVVGENTDDWGSVWHVGEPGVIGEVKVAPLDDWSALAEYLPPYEILDNADFSLVNKSCEESDLFILAGTHTRPFERLQFLRGTEKIFMDLAYGTKEVNTLIEMIHDFSIREMQMWADTDVDGVSFMDDWGSQTSLLISPAMWREIFKPLYKDYCDILHAKGKYVFFHSDGLIESIYPDLIEIGINAINSQLFCMDIEGLGEKYRGKITFWGEIDRQHILPLGTTDDVRAAVRRIRKALDHGNGGVIAQCEWGIDAHKENIKAVFDEWNKKY